jgi:hypothetical protein
LKLRIALFAALFASSIVYFFDRRLAFGNDDEDVPKRDVYDLPTPVAIQGTY